MKITNSFLLIVMSLSTCIFSDDSIASIKATYRASKELNELIRKNHFPIRSQDGNDEIPVPADQLEGIKKRISEYSSIVKTKNIGKLYKDFGSLYIKLEFWWKIIEDSDSPDTRFLKYYPKLESVDMGKVEKLLERIHPSGSSFYLAPEIIEMYMIENDQRVEELCEVAICMYASTSITTIAKDLGEIEKNSNTFIYSRHGVKCIRFGSTALGLLEDGKLWLYHWE